ncbi:MAG TPA: DUF1499 domain-containing protein [Stellaceae bacterium]|nr:DUF1499 domain-containing protein [Stellaceae bacterium]
MTLATTTSGVGRSPLRHLPVLAAVLAAAAAVLLALGPIGWRAGWWHFRFAFQTLMPWAGYFGIAALAVAALALLFGRSRIQWRGVAVAIVAFAAGLLIAYVPWHYDRMRTTVPPIHDITTDPDNPPAFAAVVAVRTAEDGNPVAYEGAKIAAQQRQAYPDIAPLDLALRPDAAFNRALDAAQRMGWTIVAADDTAGRIEASDRSRWFGFTDDIVIRITPSGSGSRLDVRSSSRLGRSDFGVNAARVRNYLGALRMAAEAQG